jgi:hypothetical protein
VPVGIALTRRCNRDRLCESKQRNSRSYRDACILTRMSMDDPKGFNTAADLCAAAGVAFRRGAHAEAPHAAAQVPGPSAPAEAEVPLELLQYRPAALRSEAVPLSLAVLLATREAES